MTATSVLASTPFDSPLDHIELELRWTALRLAITVKRWRHKRLVGPPAEYRGLCDVTDEEVDVLLAGALEDASGVDQAAGTRGRTAQRDSPARCGEPLGRHTDAASAGRRRFRAERAEQRLLVGRAGTNIEPAYEKIYAYTNDDITRRWPTVGLALDVLSDIINHWPLACASSTTSTSAGTSC